MTDASGGALTRATNVLAPERPRGFLLQVGRLVVRSSELETRIVIELLLESTSRISFDANHNLTRVNSLMVGRHQRLPVILSS